MSLEVGRRVFVGTLAAGIPVLAGVGVERAWAQRGKPAAAPPDPVLRQLQADMKRAVHRLSKAPSGENVRQLSSSLRLLAAWGASAQIDQRIKDSLRGAIAREGREALLARPVDPDRLRNEARAFGFDGSSSIVVPDLMPQDDRLRRRVLDDMLADGVTARWRQLADTLDAVAVEVDKRVSAAQGGIMLAAQGNPATCGQISQQLFYLSAQMTFWCAPWFAWFVEGCGLVTSAYLGSLAAYWWLGCL